MRYTDFMYKYLPRTLDQFVQGEIVRWADVIYPHHAVLHYQADSPHVTGIPASYSLITGREKPIRVYHVTEHTGKAGNPKSVSVPVTAAITAYFKQAPRHIHRARDLARAVGYRDSFTVMDYSLLPQMVKYPTSRRLTADMHLNYLSALMSGIKQVTGLVEPDVEVPQFIPCPMPESLPEILRFRSDAWPVEQSRVKAWDSFRKLNLLWIYRAIEDEAHELWTLPDSVVLAFTLGSQGFMVTVGQLREWREKSSDVLQKGLYRAWTRLIETRTVAPTETLEAEVVGEDVEDAPDETMGIKNIRRQIDPLIESGRLSRAEVNRIETLAKRYTALPNPVGEGTLADAINIEPQRLEIDANTRRLKDNPSVLDKSLLDVSVNAFHSEYITKVMEADILRTVVSVQNAGAMIKNVKVEDGQDALNDYRTYTVELVPVNGQPSTLNIRLPKVNAEGELRNAGVAYRLDSQRGDVPVRKVAPSKVALTSYFGKFFVERSAKAVNNYGRWIVSKLSRAATDADVDSVTKITFTTSPLPKAVLPRAYTAVASDIVRFETPRYSFNFNYLNREKEFGENLIRTLEEQELTACGKVKNSPLILAMDMDGTLYTVDAQGSVQDTLDTLPNVVDPEWGEGPVEYAELGVYGKAVPLGIVMCYYRGLSQTLKDLGVHHRWVDKGKGLNLQPYETRIRFEDESLVVDLRHRAGAIVIAGLLAAKRTTPQFSAEEFNTKGVYGLVLSEMGMGRHILRELDLARDMFIDPITLDLLKEMDEPTDWEELLLRSAELLVTDDYTDEIDTSQMRVKGYERFSGFIYSRLVDAVREQRAAPNGRGKISLPPDAVLGDIIADPAMQLVEESNPIHNLKEIEALTYVGQGGRSPQTMVQRTRLYHPNDMGLVSESTPDSAKVAIRTYMTPGAKFKNLRGVTDRFDFEKDGPGNALSTTSLMNPGSTHVDPKRILTSAP